MSGHGSGSSIGGNSSSSSGVGVGSGGNALDGVIAIRNYIDRMLNGVDNNNNAKFGNKNKNNNPAAAAAASSMKILLLDPLTTQIVSAVYSQTEILQRHVYLVSRLDHDVEGRKKKNSPSKTKKQQQQSDDDHEMMMTNRNTTNNKNSHLKAICFLRPTPINIDLLIRELQNPKYIEYHLFFSAVLTSGLIRTLADRDIHERIIQIQEFYADYIPINEDLWILQSTPFISSSSSSSSSGYSTIMTSTTSSSAAAAGGGGVISHSNNNNNNNNKSSLAMTLAAGTSWAPKFAALYDRNIQGIQSMLLSVRRQPYCIRYAASSPCAEEIARDIHDAIQSDEIFHFRRKIGGGGGSGHGGSSASNQYHGAINGHGSGHVSGGGGGGGGVGGNHGMNDNTGGLLLLVLDRRDDPITPLLSQWTYQAMVHELLGLNNHRVILRGTPSVQNNKDLDEVVLNANHDEFFMDNRYSNFGELGENIQKLLQDYQSQTADHNVTNLNTISDIQAFMDKFPELKSKSFAVSKHVAIMSELARLVEMCSLMDVGQFEQELVCNDDHNTHWRILMEKLQSTNIKIPDKLRLGLLYSLKYEISGNIHMVQSAMTKGGVPIDQVQLISTMLNYAGTKARGPGLFGTGGPSTSLTGGITKMTKSLLTNVQGVQNVYSQHVPVLMDTIQAVMRGKLSQRTHPVVMGAIKSNQQGGQQRQQQQQQQVVPIAMLEHIPSEIMIFMVGGVTYEEATKIATFNKQHAGRCRIILGGSTIHNSTSFLEELKATTTI